KTARFTAAYEIQAGTEDVAERGNPRAFWGASQLPLHWTPPGRWSATVRPEVAWDPEGRWTGSRQLVKAITSTVESRVPYGHASAIFRLEPRYDNSRGAEGGFFRGGYLFTGVPALVPGQHLLEFALILTWEPPLHW